MTAEPITSGQQKQFFRFVEDAAERAWAEAGLDKRSLQRLIENGGEFQADILASIKRLSLTNEFADEEVESSYAYPKGYAPKGIGEQAAILRAAFPELGTCGEEFAKAPLPADAEAFFAIPRWEKVAKTYNEAVEKVIAAIAKTRPLYNYREGKLGPRNLRRYARTVAMLEKLVEQQPGHDILVIPAQLGLRHRGRSVRRARAVFSANEFGLGAFELGCVLLTHPERLNIYECLWVDCAGDEFKAPEYGGKGFVLAPLWNFSGGKLRFDARWSDEAHVHCGSASAFVPE